MIGDATRGRWTAFDRIEPIAGLGTVADPATGREVPSVADIASTAAGKVRVQR